MATYEEIADFTSDINEFLPAYFDTDSLIFMIEEFTDVKVDEIGIEEIREIFYDFSLVSTCWSEAFEGACVEDIGTVLDQTAEALGIKS